MINELVVKDNHLINASYKLGLTEQKILLYAISKLDTNKDQFNIIEFDAKEFTNIVGKEKTKSKRYAEIKKILRELRKKEIAMIDEQGDEFFTGWLTNIKMSNKTDKIRLKFDDDMIPYLLQLKKRFTRYELKNVIYLESKYSIRIYEIMKQYEYKGIVELSVEELRFLLNTGETYSKFYDFEKKVIEPSILEINNKEETDLKIEYVVKRKSNKAQSVVFTISAKDLEREERKKLIQEFYNTSDLTIKMGLEEEKFNDEQIVKLYEMALKKTQDQVDVYNYVKLNYIKVKERDSARSVYHYLLDALKNDHAKAFIILKTFDMGK